VPSGSVISQTPTAGTQVATGTAVSIVVSTGLPELATPNVVGQTQAAATAAITSAGLTLGPVTTASSTTVPSGSVISQTPTAGTQVATGTAVSLVVSSGLPQVATPDVVGQTEAAATAAITGAGLTLGSVTTAASTTVPAGSVISQNPAAGTQVTTGSAVALVVSSGLPQVATPNVVGRTQPAATAAITGAGLTLGSVTTAPSATMPAGAVISQNPAAGTEVTAGSAVSLVVSTGAPQVVTPSVVGQAQAAATATITGAGLSVGVVTTAASASVPAGSVISQAPAAGTSVAAGSAVALVVSSGAPTSSLAVDTVVSVDASGSVVTPPITTTQNADLLVAFVSSDGPSTTPQTLLVSGSGLSWTLRQRANTQYGASEIWTAVAAEPLTNATVISTQTMCCYDQSLTVVAFKGAAGVGASVSGGALTGTPNVALTTTRAGSLVYGVGNDWTMAEARGLGRNQVMVHEWVDVGMGTFWVQALAAPVQDAGTVATIDDVSPTTDRWNLAAIEILDANEAATVAVPDVVDTTQAAATIAITDAGLTLGEVTTAPSATVASGLVVSQTPDAGAPVAAGTAVALVISSGAAPPIATPDVVGMMQTAATGALTAASLTVGTVTSASSTTVPAGSVISQDPAAGTQLLAGSAVSLVVSSGAPVSLSVDRVVFSDGAGTRTTPAFSTTRAGELIVAFASAAGPTSTSLKQTLTVSGAGLTWTLVRRSNAQFGSSEVWSATAAGLLTNATVTATASMAGFDQSLTVVTFMGAAGTGATGAASAATGPSTVGLTTTAPGSLVYGVGNDSARAVARTLGANQTMTHEWIDTAAAQTFWVQSIASPVANAGTLATINDIAPTSDRWNLASVEILAGNASQPTVAVPAVVGLTQAAAASSLSGSGLTVGTVTSASSTTVPAGAVISQNPIAGTQVASGSAVALVVSSGLAQVATPDVVGLTQAAATTSITNAGLSAGTITTVSSATVPTGEVISQSPAAGTLVAPGSAVALAVSSGSAVPLSVDRVVVSEGVGTRVTAPFTTAEPDEVLVAFVSSDGPNTATRQTATVSGAGLSWTLVRRANAQWGTAEIWTATAASQLVNATVTATQAVTNGYDMQLVVVAFRGAGGVGASAANGGNNTAPSVSMTATEAGSLVYGVGFDPERNQARTLGSGQTMVRQWLETNDRLTFWVQSRTAPVASAGTSVTINDTAPNFDRWNLAAVEIVPR
jgi:beta-lactam-binding protein with PASTA domain